MKFSDEMEKLIIGTAQAQGLDPELAKRLVWQESRGNPQAKSPKGAMGLTQLMPGTAQDLGVSNPFDPQQNLTGGFKYLAQQIKKFGDVDKGLAAYNFGPGNVQAGKPWPAETKNYVNSIDGNPSGGQMNIPPASIPAPVTQDQNGGIAQLLALMQPAKRSKGQMIGDMLSSLAPVAASFHSPQAQAQAEAINANRFAREDEAQKSRVSQLLALATLGGKDTTSEMKDYDAAVKQGYKGTLFDYQKELKQAGAYNPTINIGNTPISGASAPPAAPSVPGITANDTMAEMKRRGLLK
jgi:hypothetical protein